MPQATNCATDKQNQARQSNNGIPDRPALLFSGQGSQVKNMGKDIAEADKDAMNFWQNAEKISGLPLREIFWDGEEKDMSDTRALQPALTVAHLNLWKVCLNKYNPNPVACAGHSLGEFSALAASGVLSPEDAIRITSLRGRLMAEADPEHTGAMGAIVKLPAHNVEEIVRETCNETGDLLIAANYNTPDQTVISGTRAAVALAGKKAKASKGRYIELKVSGAFHSPMMEEANMELQPLLEKVTWHDPRFPVYCNVDAKPAHTGQQAKKSIWQQMVSPVYWVNLIRNLYLMGVRWWMEISPRAVLGKMLGPALAGIAAQADSLRIDLLDSLASINQLALTVF